VIDPERSFKVTGVKIHGLNAIAEFEPWEGNLPDPVLKQPDSPRKGYKISVLGEPHRTPWGGFQ